MLIPIEIRIAIQIPSEVEIIIFFLEVFSSTHTHAAASKQDPCFGPCFKILVQIHLGETVSQMLQKDHNFKILQAMKQKGMFDYWTTLFVPEITIGKAKHVKVQIRQQSF